MADAKISQLSAATTPLAGTEVLPIVQGGATKKVSVDNLTTGKTVPANGIVFPATQVAAAGANTLDDYEEGTWTASWQGGANVTGTPTLSQGKYTKIGRQVTLQGIWTINVTTGSTEMYGAFTVPFARDEAADRTVGVACGYSNWRIGFMSTGSPTTTTLYIVFPAASAVPAGTDTFNFCVTYFTTT